MEVGGRVHKGEGERAEAALLRRCALPVKVEME